MTFNIKDHITYRNQRYLNVNLDNSRLLGLGVVEINPTELCNRTCSFCPRSNPEVYPNRNLNMSVETAKILVAQLKRANYDGDIHITGFGEPTLNPNILEVISVCAEQFHTEMITNGDKLLAGKLTQQQLKRAGLGTLIVDCYDGPEQVENMHRLLEDCKIYYRIRNHHDTGEAELIKIYNYNNRGGLVQHEETLFRPCWLPFYKSFVDWNGEVRLCCNDWSRSQPSFGNIFETEFDKIWMSKELTEVREVLNKGNRRCLSACKKCNTNGTQNGFESVRLWKI
jgi:MoaA/NifB/PqqE/SkfB family radical SAM enzyme